MSDPIPHSDDPKIQAKIDKAVHHNSLVDYTLRWLLHYIERIIAVMTILALLGALGVEIYHMIASGAAYFADVETMLHHILNISSIFICCSPPAAIRTGLINSSVVSSS